MDIVEATEQVKHDCLDVVLGQFSSLHHHGQQVSALSFKHIVKILVGFRLVRWLEHVVELDHVSVAPHASQNFNFSQQPLCVDRIVEDLANFLNGHKLVRG
jgi:hypothetical protein